MKKKIRDPPLQKIKIQDKGWSKKNTQAEINLPALPIKIKWSLPKLSGKWNEIYTEVERSDI